LTEYILPAVYVVGAGAFATLLLAYEQDTGDHIPRHIFALGVVVWPVYFLCALAFYLYSRWRG
jgi:hypothetical protein